MPGGDAGGPRHPADPQPPCQRLSLRRLLRQDRRGFGAAARSLLKDRETRAGLAAEGIDLPRDTRFVAAVLGTVTDAVTLFREDGTGGYAAEPDQVEAWLAAAGRQARTERAARLPGATARGLLRRASDWAEIRPEWGLAGCGAFIAAPRAVTAGRALQGRAFLHSCDWTGDAGFATLALILTAPVVVASWISLQDHGSTVAPELSGGGNKLIHDGKGGIGVVEGNGGHLRPGLPWQALHDGVRPAHEALRLSVKIEAPSEVMTEVLRLPPPCARWSTTPGCTFWRSAMAGSRRAIGRACGGRRRTPPPTRPPPPAARKPGGRPDAPSAAARARPGRRPGRPAHNPGGRAAFVTQRHFPGPGRALRSAWAA